MYKYWLISGLVLLAWIGLLFLNKTRFSEHQLMTMINTPGKYRNVTTDFCQYKTGLDPKEPDMRYVKINFVCGDRSALNTISWVTIGDQTIKGIIDEVAKINGVKNENIKFDCNIDGAKATMVSKLSVGNQITCKVN